MQNSLSEAELPEETSQSRRAVICNNAKKLHMDKILYNTITTQIDNITKKFQSCCEIGCSFCCYQMIEVYDFEKEEIQNAIKNLTSEEKKQIEINLGNWLDFFNENTPNNKILDEFDTIKNLINISKTRSEKCPLLINNLCSIYEKRPITCRIHSVKNFPQKCKEDPHRSSSPEANDLRAYTIQFISRFKRSELFFLPFIVAEEIKTDRKIKPLKKLFI
ncbi:YkgJ family cysteine cluster protein [Riemerella anatipestifer]|nr:YkgJ family cysteine cluster protein [Riemerella anatipestifer]